MFSAADLTKGGRLARWSQWAKWLYRSSTLRLTLLLTAIFAIGMAVAIFLALSFGRDAVFDRVDRTLADFAASVEVDDTPANTFSVIIRPLDALGDLPRDFNRVARSGGGTVSLPQDYRGAEHWRVLVSRDMEGEPVLVAAPLDDSEDALELLGNALWTTTGLVMAAVLAIGIAAGLFAQRRMMRINTALGRLAAGDLRARTGITRALDDLDDLAGQVDHTADGLERLVAQTRHLSASLAHDLRTPLARLRARLEMLPEGEERAAALEEAERLSGIFDTIMRVARIEAGQGTDSFETINLAEFLQELEDIFGAVVEDSGKTLNVNLGAPEPLFADRKMLVQAMANLIQNAIVHGGPDISLFATGREIGVADTGDGVPAESYEDIVKPMVRLDAARETEGTGLGLALVRAVADRHGANLVLAENQPKGLRVAIKFTKM